MKIAPFFLELCEKAIAHALQICSASVFRLKVESLPTCNNQKFYIMS